MTYFPFFMDVEDKRFLIIGGGAVAKEKVSRLRQFTDNISVIAPKTDIGEVCVKRKHFEESDLEEADICICAAGDRELDLRVAKLCKERGIPVNVADAAELCTFIFPALVKRGDLVIGITTSGTSPAYASLLRSQIEEGLPADIEKFLDLMGEIRDLVPCLVSDPKERKEIYKRILSDLLSEGGAAAGATAGSITEKYISNAQISEITQMKDPGGGDQDG